MKKPAYIESWEIISSIEDTSDSFICDYLDFIELLWGWKEVEDIEKWMT